MDDSLLGEWERDGFDDLDDLDATPASAASAEPTAAEVAARGAAVAKRQESQSVALVAVFDANGQPMVARTIMDGAVAKRLEDWRSPTPDEYNALMWGGKIVKGGVVGQRVPAGTNLAQAMQRVPLGAATVKPNWKKIGLLTVGAAVVVGGGYYAYRKWAGGRK